MGISCFAPNKIATLLFICFLYLIQNTAHAENKAVPTANLNLPPFLKWRNAIYCLRNYKETPNNPCPWKYTLNLTGSLNVTNSDKQTFCINGCADHTRAVLHCIYYVKSDFWFANKATLKDLTHTLDLLCKPPLGANGSVEGE